MTPEVKISLGGRLHLGLISMHENAPRRNGGIGFGVKGLDCELTADREATISLNDVRRVQYTAIERDSLCSEIKATADGFGWPHRAKFTLNGDLRSHVGLGSGTAVRLAMIEALSILNNHQLTQTELIAASGRGGTSGIGIQTYFCGGFFLDLGAVGGGAYLPSSKIIATATPTIVPRISFPNWPMVACIPKHVEPKSHDEEVEFFKRATPIGKGESEEAAYVSLFQIYAGVADQDYKAFCDGIKAMQRTRFKALEIAEYGEEFQALLGTLEAFDLDCVGMSSLGPMLYCFGHPQALSQLAARADELDCDIRTVLPRNSGRVVRSAI